MLPSKAIGKAVDSIRETNNQDFSSLMPRPGWQKGNRFLAHELIVALCNLP